MLTQLVNKAFEETGLSKTQFAKALDLNKSFVLRVMSGEKALSENMLERLNALDGVTLGTKTRLNDEYHRYLFGNKAADDIAYFLEKLNGFEALLNDKSTNFVRSELLKKTLFADPVYSVVSESEIFEIAFFLAERAIRREKGRFWISFDSDCDALSALLYSVFSKRDFSDNLDFRRIMYVKPDDTRQCLDAVFEAARWGDIALQSYAGFCSSQARMDFFPCYLITDEAAMLFNLDSGNGMLVSDRTALELYAANFETIFRNYVPLCVFVADEISTFRDGVLIGGSLLCSIEGSPCVVPFLDYEISDEITHKELPDREFLINGVLHYYQSMEFNPNYAKYVSRDALKQFAKDGELKEITSRYACAVPPGLRKEIFAHMKEPDKFPVNMLILNQKKLNPYREMIVDLHSEKLIVNLHPTCAGNTYTAFYVELPYEDCPSLELLMTNTVKYLEGSKYVTDKAFTERAIDECMIYLDSLE